MRRTIALHLLFDALVLCAPLAASAVTIQWSPLDNAGHANDPATGGLYGGVGYNGTTDLGTHDVTNGQYAEFLKTKDPGGANPPALWNSNMATIFRLSFNK
jgi:uncharacterized protein (DUF2237 family)